MSLERPTRTGCSLAAAYLNWDGMVGRKHVSGCDLAVLVVLMQRRQEGLLRVQHGQTILLSALLFLMRFSGARSVRKRTWSRNNPKTSKVSRISLFIPPSVFSLSGHNQHLSLWLTNSHKTFIFIFCEGFWGRREMTVRGNVGSKEKARGFLEQNHSISVEKVVQSSAQPWTRRIRDLFGEMNPIKNEKIWPWWWPSGQHESLMIELLWVRLLPPPNLLFTNAWCSSSFSVNTLVEGTVGWLPQQGPWWWHRHMQLQTMVQIPWQSFFLSKMCLSFGNTFFRDQTFLVYHSSFPLKLVLKYIK